MPSGSFIYLFIYFKSYSLLVNLHVYNVKQARVLFCKVECVFCTPFSIEETKPGCPEYWQEEANSSVARREHMGISKTCLGMAALQTGCWGHLIEMGTRSSCSWKTTFLPGKGCSEYVFLLPKFSNTSSLPNQFNTGVKVHTTHSLPVVAVHVYFEGHLDIKIGYWSNSRHLLEALFMHTSKEKVFRITHANLSFQDTIRFG